MNRIKLFNLNLSNYKDWTSPPNNPIQFSLLLLFLSNTHWNIFFTVQLQLSGVPVHLEGANLKSTYILEQIHFHWPAEHTVDNNRDALELHFVHYKEQYGNTSAASKHENGIAVVATLFEVCMLFIIKYLLRVSSLLLCL